MGEADKARARADFYKAISEKLRKQANVAAENLMTHSPESVHALRDILVIISQTDGAQDFFETATASYEKHDTASAWTEA